MFTNSYRKYFKLSPPKNIPSTKLMEGRNKMYQNKNR